MILIHWVGPVSRQSHRISSKVSMQLIGQCSTKYHIIVNSILYYPSCRSFPQMIFHLLTFAAFPMLLQGNWVCFVSKCPDLRIISRFENYIQIWELYPVLRIISSFVSKCPDLRISHLGGEEGGLSEVQMFSDFTAEHFGIFRPKYLQTLMVLMVNLHLATSKGWSCQYQTSCSRIWKQSFQRC